MTETDRQTDKTTRWAFTAYEDQWYLFKQIPDKVKEWGWQTEKCPTSGRLHYQGYILTRTQNRHKAMREMLPGVNISAAREWTALLKYCKKTETAIEGTQVSQVNERKFLKFAEALMRIATAYVYVSEIEDSNSPVPIVLDEDARYQRSVRALLVHNPDDISLYSNPQLLRAWKMSSGFWLRRVLHSYPDVCVLATGECEFCELAQEQCNYHERLEEAASELFSFLEV